MQPFHKHRRRSLHSCWHHEDPISILTVLPLTLARKNHLSSCVCRFMRGYFRVMHAGNVRRANSCQHRIQVHSGPFGLPRQDLYEYNQQGGFWLLVAEQSHERKHPASKSGSLSCTPVRQKLEPNASWIQLEKARFLNNQGFCRRCCRISGRSHGCRISYIPSGGCSAQSQLSREWGF